MRSNHGSFIKRERQHGVKEAPRIQTVGLQLGVADGDLEAQVKTAFDLAKSVGRQLNLTFTSGDPSRSAAK